MVLTPAPIALVVTIVVSAGACGAESTTAAAGCVLSVASGEVGNAGNTIKEEVGSDNDGVNGACNGVNGAERAGCELLVLELVVAVVVGACGVPGKYVETRVGVIGVASTSC